MIPSVDKLRDETPGCRTKVHFNNAGAALMPLAVIDAQKNYLDHEAVTGGYEAADERALEIQGFYESMGRLLGCGAHNIAYTSSATNSFARALSAVPFEANDVILLANEDYISNQIAFLSLQKRLGVRLVRAESLPEGGVDVDSMRNLMDKHKPKLVSLTHVPTNTGLIQPVETVGQLCKERGLLYLVDGCQSAGQLPVDMKAIHCDFFTGTFRKFLRGPRGTGFLFVSDDVLKQNLWPLFVDMRGAEWTAPDDFEPRKDAKRFEDWEFNYSLVLGCRAAADYAMAVGLDNIQKRNAELCHSIRRKLSSLGLTTLDKGKHLSSIITVAIPGHEPTDVLHALRSDNINTSISSRSSALIDYDAKGVTWALRISPHYYNTEKEVEVLINTLKGII